MSSPDQEPSAQAHAEEEAAVDESKLKLPEVSLSDAAPTKSLEEEEDVLFKVRGKLYRLAEGEWKERGLGDVKLSQDPKSKKIRFVLFQQGNFKLRANFYPMPDIDIKPHEQDGRLTLWSCKDFSDSEPEVWTFMLKVKEEETAESFRKEFQKAASNNGELFKNVTPQSASSTAKESGSGAQEDTTPVPVFEDLVSLYGEVATEAATRFDKLEKVFNDAFDSSPDFYVHAPGRANIIGEHIDYHMYSVIPFALRQDVVIAVSVGDGGDVEARNTNTEFEAGSFPADSESSIDTNGGLKWYQYLQVGYRGYLKHMGEGKSPKSLKLMVDGTVPPAGGVSSSSALVVASVLAAAYAHDDTLTRQQLGKIAWHAETGVGMMGGGMDQAISAMAENGKAARIDFVPQLSSTPVPLPSNVRFIIANSMVKSAKAVDAAQRYNRRVTEGKLAAKLVAKKEGKDTWKNVKTVYALQKLFSIGSPKDLEIFLRHLSETPYSRAGLEKEFGCSPEELFADDPQKDKVEEVLNSVGMDAAEFALHKRLRHILREAQRVLDFERIARQGGEDVLQRLGELMDASHASCRDDYECSVEELDELVNIAKSNGAIGARLTGAGWGGCIIAMCTESNHPQVLDALKTEYFQRKGIEDTANCLFVSAPSNGAAVYKESSEGVDL
eukprot:gb/GECG01016781.1/.p1 GENE.gb/GECG01016781.1/~~gb/GECG01016781.1/.p1  ORF type:complete len:668 (+),score=125.42 gb/GECG01016781.1/:1-2004(+)